ncbi:hypothetical protein MMC30_002708 [Trapelia coarctata]|nr:hypothetical protein [Trapelia coarctata]
MIYEDVRAATTDKLKSLIEECCIYVEYRKAKTVTVSDVIFALKRQGTPIYGFEPVLEYRSKAHGRR